MDEDGGCAFNIKVLRDAESGEQVIVKEAIGASGGLSLDRIKEIQEMSSTQAKISLKSVRDKLIWFRHQVDKNTEDFT